MADDALLEQEQTLRTRLGRKLVEEAVAVGVGQRRQVQRDKDGRTQRIRLVPKKKPTRMQQSTKKSSMIMAFLTPYLRIHSSENLSSHKRSAIRTRINLDSSEGCKKP